MAPGRGSYSWLMDLNWPHLCSGNVPHTLLGVHCLWFNCGEFISIVGSGNIIATISILGVSLEILTLSISATMNIAVFFYKWPCFYISKRENIF